MRNQENFNLNTIVLRHEDILGNLFKEISKGFSVIYEILNLQKEEIEFLKSEIKELKGNKNVT